MENALEDSDVVRDEKEMTHEQWEQHRQYIPLWMNAPRDFYDVSAIASQRVFNLINRHKPHDVQGWNLQERRYCFTFAAVEVQIEVLEDETRFLKPPLVVDTASSMHRKILDPLRRRLRKMAEKEAREIALLLDFAMMLLRLLEETSAAIAFQSKGYSLSQMDLEDEAEIRLCSPLLRQIIIAGHIR